ncbi:MAG: hypothetical protein E6J90_40680 [Deltaproteobacteria bacterium]|nr:MAG: hypothetical protein E6J91_53305 [Deltaproteobacteria bacterium]TMQ08354.1 MAG: hypothetical protein E6J90_40680 [Deltaproteobacteria bacterium]
MVIERSFRMRDRPALAFSKQFGSLADELFKNEPATGTGFSAYIQSHGFHGRRYMAMELGRIPSDRYAEFKLDRHVTHVERLGPYERQVLAEILLASERLVMIVGYAGSGKTSTIRHVLEHYARHRPTRLVDPKRAGPYQRIRSIRPSYIYIDFNPIWTKVELSRGDEASATKCLLEEWANVLPIAVLDMFGPNEPLQLLIDCIEVALKWAVAPPRSEQFPRYRPPGVVIEFFQVFEGGLRDGKSLEDSYRKVLAALARMSAEDRIAFWHVILDVVKLHSYDEDVVIAVYDNADPMDAYLQRAIQRRLDQISTTCIHKLVAPLRPVAFEVRGYSYAHNWYPHSGPSPVDILSQRLLTFLNHPELLASYGALPADQAARATRRALDIVVRLQRGYGHHRSLGRVLAWMAGDSGRRLLDMARELFVSDQLLEVADHPTAPARVVRGRYELRALIDRLATSLGEEIIAIADHVVVELARGNAVAAADLVERLEVTMRTVLANAQQVSRSDLHTVTLADVQCTLRDPDLVTGARTAIRESVAAALQLIANSERNGDRRKDVLDEICARFTALVAPAIDSVPWQHRDARDEIYAFLCSFADLESPNPEPTEIPTDDSIKVLYEVNKPFVPVQILLRSRTHTTNVFEVANRPSLCKLHVLWFLGGMPRGLATAEHMVTALRALEHSDSDILETINQFVTQDMRLIWFDRSYAYPSLAALLANPDHRAVMSRAGWGYQSALTSEIDYLLVKLGRANLGLTTQINDVVLGLRELYGLEVGIRDRIVRGVRIPKDVYTAVHDIVVRATPQFTDLASRHFRKLSRNVERDELRQCVVAYERLLTDVAGPVTGGSSSTVSCATLRCIDPYEVHCAPVYAAPALAELRRALAGNRFWVDGMAADEHHGMLAP